GPAAGARCAIHPDSAATDICARCGAFACVRCLKVDLQGRGVCESCFLREGANVWDVPWERRSELGLMKGYWETTKATFEAPTLAYAGLKPTTGNMWDPISYSIISAYFAFSGS